MSESWYLSTQIVSRSDLETLGVDRDVEMIETDASDRLNNLLSHSFLSKVEEIEVKPSKPDSLEFKFKLFPKSIRKINLAPTLEESPLTKPQTQIEFTKQEEKTIQKQISSIIVSAQDVITNSLTPNPSKRNVMDIVKLNRERRQLLKRERKHKRPKKRVKDVEKLAKQGKIKLRQRKDLLKDWETTIMKSHWKTRSRPHATHSNTTFSQPRQFHTRQPFSRSYTSGYPFRK